MWCEFNNKSFVILGRFKHGEKEIVQRERWRAVNLTHAAEAFASELEVCSFWHSQFMLLQNVRLPEFAENIRDILCSHFIGLCAVNVFVNAFHFFEKWVEQQNRSYSRQKLFEVTVFIFSLVKQVQNASGYRLWIVDAQHSRYLT